MNTFSPSVNTSSQKSRVTLLAGKLAVTVNPPFLHIGFSGPPSRDALRRLGPPRLCGGLRADHLTIPFEPLTSGQYAGCINVHLTYKIGGESVRKTVAAVPPATVASTFETFGRALLMYYLTKARRVTIDELRRDGYFVVRLSDDASRWFDERMNQRRWVQRLNEEALNSLQSNVEFYDVEIMEDMHRSDPGTPIQVIRESDCVAMSVGYRPRLDQDHPEGWYALPMQDQMLAMFDEVMPVVLGRGFYEKVAVIARELQGDFDWDALERGQALSTRVR